MPCGRTYVIPAHTPVIEATNLPQGGYWAEPWHSQFDVETDSWMRNYGFHLTDDEVEDAPEDADVCYLGSFDLSVIEKDEPVRMIDFAIRVITEDEAEELITDPSTGLDSYVFPSEVEVSTI
jgi:hypothetical protein